VYTFAVGDLDSSTPTQRIVAPNFEAGFADDDTLYVTGADAATFASGVYEVDLATNTATLVVNDIGGASAGVAVRDGVLFTGNGFDTTAGGSDVGEVRAVELSALGNSPVSFESAMTPVADALSANSLGFDPLGNLLIGGGDSFGGSGDIGYAGVIDGDAIDAALAGAGFAPGPDLQLSPAPDQEVLYSLRFNEATDELLVNDGTTVFRYLIPAPGAASLLAIGGVVAMRRRRHG
jgi:hypothetical protein